MIWPILGVTYITGAVIAGSFVRSCFEHANHWYDEPGLADSSNLKITVAAMIWPVLLFFACLAAYVSRDEIRRRLVWQLAIEAKWKMRSTEKLMPREDKALMDAVYPKELWCQECHQNLVDKNGRATVIPTVCESCGGPQYTLVKLSDPQVEK